MKKKVFDPKFGINDQALEVAKRLNKLPLINPLVEMRTFQFFNGREKGICIAVSPDYNNEPCADYKSEKNNTSGILYIKFGENRNSDSIFIEHIISNKLYYNQPTQVCGIFTEDSYYGRPHYGYGKYDDAAKYIIELIQKYSDGLEPHKKK